MNGLWISKSRICVLKYGVQIEKSEESLHTPAED